jgi:hypothetical protein
MHVNNTTCRVGSKTACQQHDMSCWAQTCYNRHVCLYVYMHVNITTCRVRSNTTCRNQHVGLFVHACQQYDMSCWVQHTCYNRHVCLYVYMHVNITTCRVGSNTHVIIGVYVCTCTCMSTSRHVVLDPTAHVVLHSTSPVLISMYVRSCMHVNNTACRVGSNTTPHEYEMLYSVRMLSRKG